MSGALDSEGEREERGVNDEERSEQQWHWLPEDDITLGEFREKTKDLPDETVIAIFHSGDDTSHRLRKVALWVVDANRPTQSLTLNLEVHWDERPAWTKQDWLAGRFGGPREYIKYIGETWEEINYPEEDEEGERR